MWRHLSRPRDGWKEKVEKLGLVYPVTELSDGTTKPYWNESAWYEVTMDEVLALEAATEELYSMCLTAVDHMVKNPDRFTDEFLFLPAGAVKLARESWERQDKSIYARFDLVWNGGAPKMLEINGDTPTGLVETGVVQWDWLEEEMADMDQWNSVHDRLVKWWRDAGFTGKRVHFFHSEQEESGEEEMTVLYMRDTANLAGVTTYGNPIEQVGWNRDTRRFVDWGEKNVDTAFKLYPWEDMLSEEFGQHIMLDHEMVPVEWIEPAWKLFLSTKAVLPVLWELFPDHPNLLPAYFDGPRDLQEWVAKPFQGREGANIRIHTLDAPERVQDGAYDDQPMVYQQYVELPSYDGNRVVLGSWVVGGASAGMLVRESDGPVTDYYSRVVPHVISDGLRPDADQVQKWLHE